jgi:two-component system, LytTR family, sensor kinase
MSKKRITYIHIFIWLFAIFANLPYSNIGHNMQPQMIISNVIAFLYLMLVFYLFYLLLVPHFLDRKRIASFLMVSFIVVLIMPFFGYTILFLVRAFYDGTFQNFYHGYSVRMHMSGYYPVLTASVFGSFFRVIINWFSTMNQKAELDKQKVLTELDLLKSKLNPHFLFNTLNNIDSLIKKNAEKASESLIRLSDIMRYLTYETSAESVDLKKEVDYINNIIELYRLRIKASEDIRVKISGDQSVKIAPALFVPLIENAFKFALFDGIKPAIDIDLISERGKIVFEISNFFDKYSKIPETDHSGFGLKNLKKRLDLAYPEMHELTIETGENIFKVRLSICTNAN